MRRALTMIELVFVIVVIGILSAVLIPRMERDSLREAALQVASHIRYTQHLAMVDDKYVPNIGLAPNGLQREVEFWYKGRWQLAFHNRTTGTVCENGGSTNWSYSIFSDGPGTTTGYTGNPDRTELAVNPLNPSKLMSGGYTLSTDVVSCDDAEATREMNLGYTYGVADVDFTGGCNIAVTRQRIFFDHLGRPFYGPPHLQSIAYNDATNVKLLKTPCLIELCETTCTSATDDQKVKIQIEPETGYVHVLN